MKAISLIKNFISRVFYPSDVSCAICGNELDESSCDGLCRDCSVPFIESYCEHCGRALENTSARYCSSCLYIDKENDRFDVARAPFRYSTDSVRKLVLKLKYSGNPNYADIMAKKMFIFANELIHDADILTFVPMHPKKQVKRGYNQSEELTKRIAAISDKPVAKLLRKIKYTETSAKSLGRADRFALVNDTFELIADVKDKRVLLIDDVFTTGATAGECCRLLKEGRARIVSVLTFATSDGDKETTYDPSDDHELISKFSKENR